MKPSFLPVPKVFIQGEGKFHLHDGLNVFVNKAKVQDHVIDLFGFIWRNFKVNLKITAIRDRDFKEEYESGFFLFITGEDALPDSFPGILTSALARCQGEGYILQIQGQSLLICSHTTRGFYNGVISLQQSSEVFTVVKNAGNNKTEIIIPVMDIQDHPDLDLRAVHIDLKRQMHSLEYLKDYIRMLARFKINAVVWEWEDKFPFKHRPEIKHPLAFNAQETTELIELCRAHGIEAIPLVQTYGHLEFVLKKEQYAHLKENKKATYDPYHTLDICALHDETMKLIADMIADMVSYHHRSRYIHVGGDEVYTIGTCEKCKAFVEAHGNGDAIRGKSKLYIMHVNRVIQIVKGFGKIPLIWHDYLLKYPACIDELDKDVVIVYWMYGKDKSPADFAGDIAFFKQKGFKVLVASSVNSDFQYAIPNYDVRLQNIHDLNKASLQDPAGNVGALATNWACCRAPMETSIPAVLFFADASWNVRDVSYSRSVPREFAPRLLRRLFSIPDEDLKKHERAIDLLIDGSTRPTTTTDLHRVDEVLGEAIDAWTLLVGDARASLGVAENIMHGLMLQRLKVHLFLLIRHVEALFDLDHPPRMTDLDALHSGMKTLAGEFASAKVKTRALFGKVMYDEEVADEIDIRFTKPSAYLESLRSFIANLHGQMSGLESQLEKHAPVFRGVKDHGDLVAFSREHDAMLGAIRGFLQGHSPLPLVDSLERYLVALEGAMQRMPVEITESCSSLVQSVRQVHDAMDSFLVEVARCAMDLAFLGRF
ncbi:MAG: family 20 glycosylhydrolase [Candidatus Lokiarchaeota archaeon]|nr:family 20 glycosylhydrolase [Candidatus Lokiarchaeota archaeon]